MYKILSLIILFICGSAVARQSGILSSSIGRITPSAKQNVKSADLCSTCVSTFDLLIYFVIDGIMELGIATTCDDLCQYVTQKSQSPYLEAICSIGCDIVGINEFIRIATKVDLDPIYFCELLTICPINDHGDAKIKAFVISPPHATASTKFVFDVTFQSVNGTGTGQLLYTVKPVDDLKISSFLLMEEKKPGLYAERFAIDTTPDPDCESDINPCEEWLPGVYNVTVMICNGECNSQHPHSQVYDTVKGSFQID
ncbi:unnamed protein product [Adineta ricciae]|uniref:Saposin B-type domain-containing protein n=1 Tax=Adineta ricciae TaxID=249248 RepID=A0A815PMR2_ADIRI|nr:unnamed protein product [Adineta ricciae]